MPLTDTGIRALKPGAPRMSWSLSARRARPRTSTFGLNDTGQYGTSVWDYSGISSLGATRVGELAMHPTAKPVALIDDALKCCSRFRDIILDVFGGSGSTSIATDQCGRIARLIEFDPLYCDTIIRRFERLT